MLAQCPSVKAAFLGLPQHTAAHLTGMQGMMATEVRVYKGWNWHFSPCTKDSRGLKKMVSQRPKADPMLKSTLILTDISSVIFQERPSEGAAACGGHERRLRQT